MEPDEVLSNYAEAWGELRELIQTRGWDFFTDRLQYEFSLHQRRVLSGRLDTADYQRECGVLLGLQLALELPQRIKNEYDQRLAVAAEEDETQLSLVG